MNTRNGSNSSWQGKGPGSPRPRGDVLATMSELGKGQMSFDASVLLWVIIFASSATVGDRRRDRHLQWVQDPNMPKALTTHQVNSVTEKNREQGGRGRGSVWEPVQKWLSSWGRKNKK